MGGSPSKRRLIFRFRRVEGRDPIVSYNMRHVSDGIFSSKHLTRLSFRVKIDSVFALDGFCPTFNSFHDVEKGWETNHREAFRPTAMFRYFW